MFSLAVLSLLGLLVPQACLRAGADWFQRIFLAVMGAFFGCTFGVLLAVIIGASLPTTVRENATYELASLRTTESINGVFVLGSGSINEQTVYRVLVRNSDGSVSPHSIPGTLDTRIIEDESLQGRGTLTIRFVVHDGSSFWADWAIDKGTPRRILYEIHVPKGSVLTEFSVQ